MCAVAEVADCIEADGRIAISEQVGKQESAAEVGSHPQHESGNCLP